MRSLFRNMAILFLVTLAHLTFSQKLTLSGKVSTYYSLPKKGKLYYAESGKLFDKDQYVFFDSNSNYEFEMRLKKIKETGIKEIVFALDSTIKPSDKYACTQTIHVENIVNAKEFKMAKSIELKADLPLNENCEDFISDHGAKEDGYDHLVGTYTMSLNDTIHNVELQDLFYEYKATLSKMDGNYMDTEFGSWSYRGDELVFKVWKMRNENFGTRTHKRREYVFKVVEVAGKLTFQSDSATLIKL